MALQLNIVYTANKLVSSLFINKNIFVWAGVLLNTYDVILNGWDVVSYLSSKLQNETNFLTSK